MSNAIADEPTATTVTVMADQAQFQVSGVVGCPYQDCTDRGHKITAEKGGRCPSCKRVVADAPIRPF